MIKQAFVFMSLISVVAACGDSNPSAADATPEADATVQAGIVSDLTDAEWEALCEDVITPDLTFAAAAENCAGEDCEASSTAVEDCIAEVQVEPQDCSPPSANDPIRQCGATIATYRNCLEAFFTQFLPYATATCANVSDLPFATDDGISHLAACDALLAKCPDVAGD